jgi:putative ABC transport system ATP-binding protein
MPMSSPVAQLEAVDKVYGSGDTAVHALDKLDLTVNRGDYLAVMGASGSGKSTAMNILGCLDRPSSGSYLLNGTPVEGLSDDQLADLRNRDLGFVFQQFHLLPQLSALENVMLPMVYAGVPAAARRERAQAALERVGLGQRLNNKPNQLSGGQQQRVAIARAIINQPALLLADEPTGALDSQTTAEVLDIFDALHQGGMTVVMVTHEDDVAARAEKIVRFRDGHILG